MRFRPTLPSTAKATRPDGPASSPGLTITAIVDGTTANIEDDTDEPQPAELDFAPYDPDTLDERHTDDILQSLATPEALDKSLRRLDEQARGTIEEQGVNVLFLALGMLHYTDSAESTEVYRAPLVMLPVALHRKSARTGYTVEATDDEPIVNPALAEYLRTSFGIELPALGIGEAEGTAASLQAFYKVVADVVAERTRAGMKGWAVKTDIFLGMFSFQKLVMFKDLEANSNSFVDHALVRRLITREREADAPIMGLPNDVRGMDLDRSFAPENTAQVVDADSSQLRAIAAISKGYSLVLEGPPGTGKSQTITNLIAQALSEGKSVLFVAEKMAALQVVHSRLVNAGLGEFCLELHASKANKRAVMGELRTAIDASLQHPHAERTTARLPVIRTGLSDYARALHFPGGALQLSPYAAIGKLDEVLDAPRFPFSADVQTITRDQLTTVERTLDELAVAAEAVGNLESHPWRDTGRTLYLPRALEEIGGFLTTVITKLDEVDALSAAIREQFAFPVMNTLADVQTSATIARLLHESPGAPLSVLQSDAWNSPPAEATSLIETGRRLQRERQALDQKFTEAVFDQEHVADVAYVEQKSSGALSFLSFLDGRFRAIKRRWLAYRKPGYSGPLLDQANDLKQVDKYTLAQRALEGKAAEGRALFGGLWLGERSDWTALSRYVEWVVKVRGAYVQHGLSAESVALATRPKPDVTRVIAAETAAKAAAGLLSELSERLSWPTAYFDGVSLRTIVVRLRAMQSNLPAASTWATFEQLRQTIAQSPAAELLAHITEADRDAVSLPSLSRMFRRAVLEQLLEEMISSRQALRDFRTLTHEQRIKEFRELDERTLHENRASVVSRLRESTQRRLQEPASRAGLPFLQKEMAKQRNIAPLRRLLQNAEATVRAIKPCFLMSPLTVAQYLDGKQPTFDLVIFDEASQLPSEDAVGAIARGRQLVVVGDPKQLPPTNFFSSAGQSAAPVGEDGQPIVEDTESVLEEFMGAGVPVTRLKWHYRSAHESLISFSNVSFYDSDLYTFPSVETNSESVGLSFEHVADGVYQGKGLNMAEARRVVDAVIRHAKERPDESLGVGTFNMRQQLAILDELEVRRREDPSLEPFFSRGAADPFFVKNLENIQGDERDVIFLSVTYGRSPDGRLRYNFGPINGENGWRRLNVLTTRARKRMRVFSSMRGDDINAAASTSRGAALLRDFLKYAEFGRLDSVVANASAATESPFEQQVAAELTRRGVKIVPQVGVAGYRIDLGVLDDAAPGRFVCGIECDGVAYHSSETARDRDRLRQQVLEARGWTIIRVWSTDWFKDREAQIERLVTLIAKAKVETAERVTAEADAELRARKEAESERREGAERRAKEDAQHLARVQAAASAGPYVRPSATPYQFAPGNGKHAGSDLLDTPTSFVVAAVMEIVDVESPIHVDDLFTRVGAFWSVARVGSRIRDKIRDAVDAAARSGGVAVKGDYIWRPSSLTSPLTPRSRSGTRIPGERVPMEEVQAAIVLVLRAAGGLRADELLSEVRQVLGVGKAALAPTFDVALRGLTHFGTIGEGSAGFALRG
jgi:very-short-patch-repair endonuclease